MLVLIATITVILYIILIAYSLSNLKTVTNKKVKIGYVVIGLFVMLICTIFIFNISISGMEYDNKQLVSKVRNLVIAVFIPVNGLIVMPYLANLLTKVGANKIKQEDFKTRIIILSIIFIIVLIFECSYLKGTHQGIINMINNK